MAQTFTKLKLSGSTNGRPIGVTPTSTAGETIHTAHATRLHQVLLRASNIHTAAVELTLEIGGTGAGDQVKYTIQPKDTIPLDPILITGSVVIAAFADQADKINIFGEVNEIA